jgi:hypothetical protein
MHWYTTLVVGVAIVVLTVVYTTLVRCVSVAVTVPVCLTRLLGLGVPGTVARHSIRLRLVTVEGHRVLVTEKVVVVSYEVVEHMYLVEVKGAVALRMMGVYAVRFECNSVWIVVYVRLAASVTPTTLVVVLVVTGHVVDGAGVLACLFVMDEGLADGGGLAGGGGDGLAGLPPQAIVDTAVTVEGYEVRVYGTVTVVSTVSE